MEIKEEKLDEELVTQLKKLRDDNNKLTILIGQEEMRRRDLKVQIERIENELSQYHNIYKKNNIQLNSKLNDLEKNYPNGEVDVDKGVIYYEEKT